MSTKIRHFLNLLFLLLGGHAAIAQHKEAGSYTVLVSNANACSNAKQQHQFQVLINPFVLAVE